MADSNSEQFPIRVPYCITKKYFLVRKPKIFGILMLVGLGPGQCLVATIALHFCLFQDSAFARSEREQRRLSGNRNWPSRRLGASSGVNYLSIKMQEKVLSQMHHFLYLSCQ